MIDQPSLNSPRANLPYVVTLAASLLLQAAAAEARAADESSPGPLSLQVLKTPVLFAGDANHAYRDPAVVYHDGVFHMYYTYNPPSGPDRRVYWHLAESTSRNLRDWSAPRLLTPQDQ